MSDGRLARRSKTREQLHRSAVRRSVIRVCLLRARRRGIIFAWRGHYRAARIAPPLRVSRRRYLGVTGRRDTSISRDSPFLSSFPLLPPRASSTLYLNSLRDKARSQMPPCASRLFLEQFTIGSACNRTQSERGGIVYKTFPAHVRY